MTPEHMKVKMCRSAQLLLLPKLNPLIHLNNLRLRKCSSWNSFLLTVLHLKKSSKWKLFGSTLTQCCYLKLDCTFLHDPIWDWITGWVQRRKQQSSSDWDAKEGQWASGCGPKRRQWAPTLDASRYETLEVCNHTCHQCESVCSRGCGGWTGGTRTKWRSHLPEMETDKGSSV